MKTQMQLHTLRNRLRRIPRRIEQLGLEKAEEIRIAEKQKRDPNLGEILRQMNRLNDRLAQLMP